MRSNKRRITERSLMWLLKIHPSVCVWQGILGGGAQFKPWESLFGLSPTPSPLLEHDGSLPALTDTYPLPPPILQICVIIWSYIRFHFNTSQLSLSTQKSNIQWPTEFFPKMARIQKDKSETPPHPNYSFKCISFIFCWDAPPPQNSHLEDWMGMVEN